VDNLISFNERNLEMIINLKVLFSCVDDGIALRPAAVSVWLCGVTKYPSYVLGMPSQSSLHCGYS
jgi:hypothetical protein